MRLQIKKKRIICVGRKERVIKMSLSKKQERLCDTKTRKTVPELPPCCPRLVTPTARPSI